MGAQARSSILPLDSHEAIARAAEGSIRVENVSVRFGRGVRGVIAVRDIDLAIAPGEFVSLLGPSGCGKSTLLNAIGGLVRPAQGRVIIDGAEVREPSARCAIVFQQHSLFPWLTALDNVAFGPRRLGRPNAGEIARELLAVVGLERFADSYPGQLSGGMQQRVGIARALATQPPVLLMDEPFGALDAQTRVIMQEELLKIWEKFRTTVVFVTHDVDEALFLSDRVIIMRTAPGSIKEELIVDLPRPRTQDLMLGDAFAARRREVKKLIREESLKAFSLASARGAAG